MGNILVHLCPATTLKISARAKSYRRVNRRQSDTSHLCTVDAISEEHIPHSLSPTVCAVPDLPNASAPDLSYQRVPIQESKVITKYVNFPFLTNDEIARWIVNTRFMFILRGPPGSGKSYIAECIRLRFPSTVVCSADEFWYLESNGAEYQFDISRIAEAHQWCQGKAYDAAESGVSPLVIDNTNVRAWETRYYTDLAKRFEYAVIMVIPQTPWRFDTDALAMRNVHFVGLHAIEAKVRNFEHVFPLYYGWLWPGKSSSCGKRRSGSSAGSDLTKANSWPLEETQELLNWAWNSFITIVGLPDVRVHLASALGLSDTAPITDVLRHWHSATLPTFGVGLKTSRAASVPHITAKYARFGRAAGAQQYALSGAVTESLLGRLFTVQVTGLFFSLRTVGVRIRLPADDLVLRHLWASDDQAALSTDRTEFADLPDIMMNSEHAEQTHRPLGCRAHVTLALASDVSAVETGLDLLRIVDSELARRPGEHVAIVPGGSVRRVTVKKPSVSPSSRGQNPQFTTAPLGHEYMYVYDLDEPQHHRVLFAGAY
ncbi:2',3'-cyclic-nucleotide 3'-phosphodiesterase [Clonorchis sinensis]|uniref:2',3'-cyclic-nucleotide 3'-phosphodiesterase n=2 Tax=Clonorchis sinensis TaxID=79923 RepID=H2KS11_CLOSI|nr:2',3'-cyclic-nucleotide 3'-phosphodiesterase [Clonorchis sinensis]GAA36195.2 2' 3'-cyclic-nucleotide 3'-phosphodiesterase [Clonorchis sinensis]